MVIEQKLCLKETQPTHLLKSSLGQAKVKFKIDTGGDVTVIPETVFLQTGLGKLQKDSR